MKKFIVSIEIAVEAEDDDDAYGFVHNLVHEKFSWTKRVEEDKGIEIIQEVGNEK